MENSESRKTPEPLGTKEQSPEAANPLGQEDIVSLASRLSLAGSIPSIDRSSDGSNSPREQDSPEPPSTVPNLAHTPPGTPQTTNKSILAHTPPPLPPANPSPRPPSNPSDSSSSRPPSNPPPVPPPNPPSSTTPSNLVSGESGDESQSSPSHGDSPPSPCPISPQSSQDDYPQDDFVPPPAPSGDCGAYGAYGSSPPSLSGGIYSGIAGLYSSSHPSSGIYSGSASLGSIYGSTPPIPPPPREDHVAMGGAVGYNTSQYPSHHNSHHRRDHSVNSIHSIHSVNSFKEFYDKSTLNRFISTSPKLSNRDMEMNRMSDIYGSVGSQADYSGLTEMFTDPVHEEQGGERVVWEFHNVCLTRVPGYGFGIAVSGGRDNPHFTNGDPSIAISDVLKAGPAEGKLQINDRLISANGVSLENVEYARAVQVLRDSGAAVQLVVKRRIVLPAQPEPQTLKITLNKNRKKDDFGIVLGCRIYVKEIGNRNVEKEGGLREGDVLLRINSTSTENLTVKEARKLLEGTKDRLQLLVRREPPPPQSNTDLTVKDIRGNEYNDSRPNYSSQNLYVQPPTRGGSEPTRIGGPQTYPGGHETPESKNNLMRQGADPRFVSFKKEGSVGIRLAGGNEVGIYVTAVQPGSQAQLQGLIPGDKILKVNDMDMSGVTREEAVLYLMSLQDQIDLIVQTCKQDYDHILNNTKGDLFYIKTHFHYEPNGKNELSFRSGDIFRVVDTLHNGVVGAWQVHRIGRNNQETQKGIIPNKARAEELATAQFNAAKKEQTQSESRGGFFKRRRNSRRSKSLGKDHWEDVVFADSVSKFPAYERVTLRHPGFVRPIVLFGPLADIARDNLLKENPAKFASPQLDSHGEKANGIIRLSAIREIMERGKHAVLDITPNAVDRLNYAQFYPVVIFLRAESKQIVKELRSGYPKGRMNSKKLFDQSVKLEKLWSHVYTATVSLTQPDTWYRKVREIVDKQQAGPLWMSETKPTEALSDDFLFPMTSRLSYASSPESDMETGPESRTPSKSPHRGAPPSYLTNSETRHGETRNRMVKSSSDPSLAAPEEISNHPSHAPPGHGGPPPYTASPTRMPPTQGGASDGFDDRRKSHGGDKLPPQGGASDGFDDRRKSHGGDSKYGFASGNYYNNDQYSSRVPGGHPQHPGVPPPGGGTGPPQSSTSPYTSPPQGYNSRHQQQQPQPPPKQNVPPPTQSPNQRRSPLAPPGRPPPQLGQSPSGGHMPGPPPPYLNGHTGDTQPPEMPPKVDRGSKPTRGRTGNQDAGGQPQGGKEGDYDANYINTGRPSSLERQQKSPYDMMSPSLGPNAHDDLKSRLHPRSPQDHYRYNRSTSQPPNYRSDDPYRSSDYKPLPPPKSNNYKPVPPPKPKNYKQQTPDSGMGGWGMYESSRKNYDRTSYHTNSNGGLSDDYSGLDSGQGSSLDRKYDTFGRSSYGKQVGSATGAGRTGYYLNVPPPRDMNNQGSHGGGGGGPGGRDLPNHDHRGSAFELYKKPPDPRGPPGGPPIPQQYTDIGNSGQQRRPLGEDANSKHKVIATARGLFDHKGGTLTSEETGVSIVIPPGALAKGSSGPQEIYFKVCQDHSLVPPLDQDKGETLLSPLVMCGPHGLAFKRPVELRLPHAASVSPNTWSFALKSSDTPSGQPTSWTNMALHDAPSSHIGSNCVSVLVDHF